MRFTEDTTFRRMVETLRSGAADPAAASRAVKDALADATALIPALLDREPPITRLVTPATLANVVFSGSAITATGDLSIQWPRNGWCRGIAATVLQGVTYLPYISFSLKINGDILPVTTGSGQGYCPLSIIGDGNADGKYFRIDWPVTTADRWFVSFTSELPVTTSALTLTPKMVFLFEES